MKGLSRRKERLQEAAPAEGSREAPYSQASLAQSRPLGSGLSRSGSLHSDTPNMSLEDDQGLPEGNSNLFEPQQQPLCGLVCALGSHPVLQKVLKLARGV